MDGSDTIRLRAVRGVSSRGFAVAVVLASLAGIAVRAQEADGYVEITVDRTDLKTVNEAGQTTDLERFSVLQRYNLDLRWNLFPNLQFLTGGLFERSDGTAEATASRTEDTRELLQPYVQLRYRTPVIFGDLGFFRFEDRRDQAGSSMRNIRETYLATFGWNPVDLPSARLRLSRDDTYDSMRQSQDLTDTLVDLTSEYEAAESLLLYYRGSVSNQQDRVLDSETRQTSHVGRVTYGNSLWNDRVTLGAEYNVNYTKTEILAVGGGEVFSPLFPIEGLSGITDTPLDVVLDANPALIDDNRTASTGVNLGAVAPGGDERPRNVGLDFGIPTALNTLRLWIDRDLPQETAATFTWEIYTSDDNRMWVSEGTVSEATFGPFSTRFELRFRQVVARYVKVVSRPLDRNAPSADQFPLILVTELEPFIATPASEAPGDSSRTNHRLTSGVRTRLLPDRNFYYDLSYFGIRQENQPAAYTISNALSISERLNPVFTVSARVAREDATGADGDSVTYPYTAGLRAVWLPTLQQSLVLSGTSAEFEDGESSSVTSIFLLNTAQLYRGITADLGIGKATSDANDQRTDSTRLNASATLVPHRRVTANVLFQIRQDDRRGEAVTGDRTTDLRIGEFSLSYRPLPTVYLFGSYRLETESGEPDRTVGNYVVGWSPFPNGSLDVTIQYDEASRSELDTVSRNFTSRIRWNITTRRYLEVAYRRSRSDSVFDSRETESLRAGLRLTF